MKIALKTITSKGLGTLVVRNNLKNTIGIITDGDLKRISNMNKDFKNLLGDILCDIVDRHYSREEVFSGQQSNDREDNTKSTNT